MVTVVPDEDGILDIHVSFDGSWLARGHKSHMGVGVVVKVMMGFVVNFEPHPHYCARFSILLSKINNMKEIITQKRKGQ